MSIKTNRKKWEDFILKDKKKSLEYLKEGMINLRSLPEGKPLSLFIGGKLEKQNDLNDIKKEKKKNEEVYNNQNIKEESFNFDNFFNSQNINELFGLDESKNGKENLDLNLNVNKEDIEMKDLTNNFKEDKTSDKTYNNIKQLNGNLKNINNKIQNGNEKEDNKENINFNIIEDSFIFDEKNIQNIFNDDFNFDNKNNNIKKNSQMKNGKEENKNIIDNFINNNNYRNNNNINNNNQNEASFDVEKNLKEFGQKYDWDEEVNEINLKKFGYAKFRPNQREIINASLCDRDIFVCMPTGGGKSLTYQIPALVNDGVTIIVMPLLSLIQDQTTYLQGCGINVLFLNSENTLKLDYDKFFHSENEDDLYKMIFLTPEKIAKSMKTMNLLSNLYNEGLLVRCVVDEAHCVSQWGREFRSDYLNLKILKQKFPKLPILALTATAPNKIRDDVINQLGMKNTVFFRSSYNRKNLYIEIRKKTKGFIEEIAKFIKEEYPNDSGLIYCSTKKNCELMAKELKTKHKISCSFYHASLTEQRKNKIQERWKNNRIKVIVATVAFGMGINKSDVRFVIHSSMPNSFESYYQEMGRAGRDGNESKCLLFYSPGDRKAIEFLVSTTNLDKNKLSESLRKITQMVDYCEEQFMCRRVMALEYFDEKFDSKDCNSMCDNCNKNLSCIQKDFTKESLIILNFVKNCTDKLLKITISQSIDYLIGKNGKQHMSWPANDKNKGALIKITPEIIKKIFRKIILLGYINEYLVNNGNNIYSRIEISQKGINYLFNKNSNLQNNLDNIFISLKGEPKKKEEESDEEDIVEESSIIESGNKNENETSEKKERKSETRKKRKKKKNGINNDEEDFGLCENRELFDKLLIRLKKKRDEILQRENGNIDNDDNDEEFHLDAFKENKKELALDEIFTDNGLKDLCRKLPTEEKELTDDNIYGVNKISLKTYGKEFLPLIKDFIEENKIEKEELEKKYPKKKKKEKKSEKKSGGKKRKKSEKKKENKNSEESIENKEDINDIIIPESGIYKSNPDDFFDEQDLSLLGFDQKNEEEVKDEEKKEEKKDEEKEEEKEEELLEKKEINTQKEKSEDSFDEILKQAKELSKINNKNKNKKSQISSESDDSDDNKKKKDRFAKYNFFQKKAILKKIRKGKHKKK